MSKKVTLAVQTQEGQKRIQVSDSAKAAVQYDVGLNCTFLF